MTIIMKDFQVTSFKEIKRFLESSKRVKFERRDRKEAYIWMERTLTKFKYLALNRKEKGILKRYMVKMTGYSRAQITRLIWQYRKTGDIKEREYKRHTFRKVYSSAEIRLLAETDEAHSFPNGSAVKKILQRMVYVYNQKEYRNIANISVGHIYNLRKSVWYQRITKRYTKTRPSPVNIGQRRKPEPGGIPGYIRVDTIHQGDNGKEKGVYHINSVDEVTQFEFLAAVERISEHYLEPLLLKLIEGYPFKIMEFHTDNGSEYINRSVVKMLNKLLIELTKSRPRHANDNALVETKNGWVLRKWMGYDFIGQKYAPAINNFYFGCFNEYLNFHRPCAFPTERKDNRGKIRKIYKHQDYMTPYEKLKTIPEADKYLQDSITFAMLDKIAMGKTDNEIAQIVQKQRLALFEKILTL